MNFMKQMAASDGSEQVTPPISDSSKRPNDQQDPPSKIPKTDSGSLPPKAHGLPFSQ